MASALFAAAACSAQPVGKRIEQRFHVGEVNALPQTFSAADPWALPSNGPAAREEDPRRDVDGLTRDASGSFPGHRWLWASLAASLCALAVVAYFLLRHWRSLNTLGTVHTQLQRSASKLKGTLDALPDLLFELGLDGRYYDYHSPRTDLLATPAPKLLGKMVTEVLPQEAAQVCMEALQEANASGSSTGRQLSLELPRGTTWFELSVAKKTVGPGQGPRFVVLSRDITERKRFEARERIRLEVFELLAQGADLSEVLAHLARHVERQRPYLECSIALLNEGSRSSQAPETASSLPSTICSEPIAGSNGQRLGTLLLYGRQYERASATDHELAQAASRLAASAIERAKMEAALAASEREFRTLAEHTPDNVVRYDAHCRRTYVNGAMENLLGVGGGARLLGVTPSESFPDGCQGAVGYEYTLRRVLATGEPDMVEVTGHRGPHSGRTFHVRMVAERDGSGQIVGALAIGRDVTERKNRENLIEESRDMLRELAARRDSAREDERKRIAREVHDELGQMLTVLRLEISTLKLQFGKDQPTLAERCDGLKDIADQTIQVVRNIAASLRPASLDMGITAALEWLTEDFRTRTGLLCVLRAREADLEFSEDQSIAVFRIVQESLTNIVRHACAYTVAIAIEATGDEYHLTIRDDGVGFDPESVRTKSFGLVGIRERALMLHGEARFITAPGAGTCVEIRIPRNSPPSTGA